MAIVLPMPDRASGGIKLVNRDLVSRNRIPRSAKQRIGTRAIHKNHVPGCDLPTRIDKHV